tara:strand:- start:38 stop:418 length:381 start_codon:yes stop_codon:yes gene_type:complete
MTGTTHPYVSRGADARIIDVKSIEGKPTFGSGLVAKTSIMGEHMTSLEITYTKGTGAPLHVHAHEPLVYVVCGRIETTIGEEDFSLELGDACLHPAGMPHTVEAPEDSTMVEIKSPALDITKFFEW